MRHDLLLQNDAMTPLGRLRLAGYIEGGRGVVPALPLRVYGSYAVTCVLRGGGTYRDAGGTTASVAVGDAILVFPERPHSYGPRGRATWDEIYLTFDGPAFDLLRQGGLLDAARPLRACPPNWLARLRALIAAAARPASPGEAARHLSGFVHLLTELVTADGGADRRPAAMMDWSARARALLDTDLSVEMDLADVAATVGMRYETFRKRFLQAVGVTPARYRAERRVAAARELLRYSPRVTNRQAAEMLGFADECHFSRRFTQLTGQTPRAFRLGAAAAGAAGEGVEPVSEKESPEP